MNENELTVEQAAQVLGVTVSTVYALVRRKKLERHERAYGVGMGGRRVYYLREDVERLARGDAPAPPPTPPAPKSTKKPRR